MKITRRRFLFCTLLSALLTHFDQAAAMSAAKGKFLVYVGTYTQEKSNSKGIYAYRFDATSGELTPLGLAAESNNPSFVVVSRDRRFLYAVDEVGNFGGSKNSGAIRAFAIDRNTGKLTFLNEVASRGADPCYLSLDKKGKYVLTANYTGGSVAAFPILRDGRLRDSPWLVQHSGIGFNPERQQGPHAHSINVSPDNHYAIVTDLGLDQVRVYRFGARTGSLSPGDSRLLKVDPGAGPRHFTFHPKGKFAYVVNEMQSSVLALRYDRPGSLHVLQKISMLPADFKGRNDAAEVQVHPSGKFLYASNRGHDSIVAFRIDSETGRLSPTGQVVEAPTPVYVKFVALE